MSELLEEIIEEIDAEDAAAIKEEVKKYIRKGRWQRVTHPVWQRGYWAGTVSTILAVGLFFLLVGPFFCK
jgi:hypothetical protein